MCRELLPSHAGTLPRHLSANTTRQPHQQRRYPPEGSLRSASLTSVLEMYHTSRMTDDNEDSLVRPRGSFYYDYSEAFEKDISKSEQVIPFSPMLQKTGSCERPAVLQNEVQADLGADIVGPGADNIDAQDFIEVTSLEAATGTNKKPVVELAHKLEAVIHDLDHGLEMHGPLLITPSLTPSNGAAFSNLVPSGQPECPSSETRSAEEIKFGTPAQHDRSFVISSSRKTTPESQTQTYQGSYVFPKVTWDRNYSEPRRGIYLRTSCSGSVSSSMAVEPDSSTLLLEKRESPPILEDFKHPEMATTSSPSFNGIVTPSQKSTEDPLLVKLQMDSFLESNEVEEPQDETLQHLKHSQMQSTKTSSDTGGCTWRRHRRNAAAMQIDNLVAKDQESQVRHLTNSSESQDSVPILSPQPISPASQLGVKNSIPQLMKALPPLPADAQKPTCQH